MVFPCFSLLWEARWSASCTWEEILVVWLVWSLSLWNSEWKILLVAEILHPDFSVFFWQKESLICSRCYDVILEKYLKCWSLHSSANFSPQLLILMKCTFSLTPFYSFRIKHPLRDSSLPSFCLWHFCARAALQAVSILISVSAVALLVRLGALAKTALSTGFKAVFQRSRPASAAVPGQLY